MSSRFALPFGLVVSAISVGVGLAAATAELTKAVVAVENRSGNRLSKVIVVVMTGNEQWSYPVGSVEPGRTVDVPIVFAGESGLRLAFVGANGQVQWEGGFSAARGYRDRLIIGPGETISYEPGQVSLSAFP